MDFNQEKLEQAIIKQVADEFIDGDRDLSGLIRAEIDKRVDKIFKDRAQAEIESAINEAVQYSFDREYQRVTQFGEPTGPKTTIRAELDRTVTHYWSAKVDSRTGKSTESTYNSVTRAEYLMTQVCAEDFSDALKQSSLNITGALKDGLRKQLGAQMDNMLNELFRVKSLMDQGKVEKPY